VILGGEEKNRGPWNSHNQPLWRKKDSSPDEGAFALSLKEGLETEVGLTRVYVSNSIDNGGWGEAKVSTVQCRKEEGEKNSLLGTPACKHEAKVLTSLGQTKRMGVSGLVDLRSIACGGKMGGKKNRIPLMHVWTGIHRGAVDEGKEKEVHCHGVKQYGQQEKKMCRRTNPCCTGDMVTKMRAGVSWPEGCSDYHCLKG